MARKQFFTAQIMGRLGKQTDVMFTQRQIVAVVVSQLGISERIYFRWRKKRRNENRASQVSQGYRKDNARGGSTINESIC